MSRRRGVSLKARPAVAAAVNGKPNPNGYPGLKPVAMRRPLGVSGTPVFGQLLGQVDYSTDWQYPAAYNILHRMRRSAVVASALRARKIPVTRGTWEIEAAEEDPQGQERADAMREMLFHRMEIPFRSFLRQGLMALEYGAMPFELVLTDVGAGAPAGLRWALRRPLQILPWTITDWNVSDDGRLLSIRQQATRESGFDDVVIPAERLCMVVHDLEGNNWRGESALRCCYKAWYGLDVLETIIDIVIEKRGAGVDVAMVDGNYEKQDELELALRNLHLVEKQYAIFEKDVVEFSIKGIEGQAYDGMPALNAKKQDVRAALGADWLGIVNEGSLALHSDKTSLGLMLAEETADLVADPINRLILAPLTAWNWGPEVPPPRLVYRKLDTRSSETMIAALAQAAQAGILTPDVEVERTVRVLGDVSDPEGGDEQLQEYDEERRSRRQAGTDALARAGDAGGAEEEAEPPTSKAARQRKGARQRAGATFRGRRAGSAAADLPDDDPSYRIEGEDSDDCVSRNIRRLIHKGYEQDQAIAIAYRICEEGGEHARAGCGCKGVRAAQRFVPRRPPQGPEVFCNFARLHDDLEDTESAVVAGLRPIQREIVDDLVEQARRIFKRGTIADLSGIEVDEDQRTEVADMVTSQLVELAIEGARSVRAEIEAQQKGRKIPASPRAGTQGRIARPIFEQVERKKIDELLAVRGRSVADAIVARLEKLFLNRVMAQAQAGQFDAETLVRFMEEISMTPVRQDVRLQTSEALGVGRRVEAEEYKGVATSAYLSAILDEITCPVCEELDGSTMEPFSDEYYEAYPPRFPGTQRYPACEGVQYCRCVLILVLDEEAPTA